MNKKKVLEEFDEQFPQYKQMCLVDGLRLDTCCIDDDEVYNCIHAEKFSKKEECEYWDDVVIDYQASDFRKFIENLTDDEIKENTIVQN